MFAPIAAARPGQVQQPIAASREALSKVLERKPVLWVGAGLSIGAGYPSTWKLIEAMVASAADPIDAKLPFFAIADAFVASVGAEQLAELLQCLFQEPHAPTPVHRALAQLARAGHFQAFITTNYDGLLERALAEHGVPYVLQSLEDNAPIISEGSIRLLKLHGSYTDWRKVILSGRSYKDFGHRYPFLQKQLAVLLRQHPVLFAGCSLQDPRILDWLARLPRKAAKALKPWRALITDKAWTEALQYTWESGHASGALAKGKVRPLVLQDHAHLDKLFGDLAAAVVSKLDLAREAVIPGTPGLSLPDRELTVVANVAAPIDAISLDYEEMPRRAPSARG